MPIYDGSTQRGKMWWGQEEIQRVYWGQNLVYDLDAVPSDPNALPVTVRPALYHFAADGPIFTDDAGTIPPTSGDTVANWSNLGIAAQTEVIQDNAVRRPVWRTGGTNGLPYLDLDSEMWMGQLSEIKHGFGFLSFTPYTAIAVVDQVATSGRNPILASHQSSGTQKASFDLPNGDSVRFFKTANSVSNALTDFTQPKIVAAVKRPSVAADFAYALNDQDRMDYDASTNNNSDSVSSARFLRNHGSTGVGFNGRFHELIYWDSDIGSAELSAVMDHLRTKYALPGPA